MASDNEPGWLLRLTADWLRSEHPRTKEGDRYTLKQCIERARGTGGIPTHPVRGNALRRLYAVCAEKYVTAEHYEMLVRYADKHIEVPVGQHTPAHDVTTLAILQMHRSQKGELAGAVHDMAYALNFCGYDTNAWVYVFLDLLDVQDCDGIVPRRA